MESLKPYLAAMNRNRFWILSAIVVLTALGVWYSAESAVAEKYTLDKGINERAYSSLGMFRRTEVNKLPNAEFKVAVDKLRVALEGHVMEAWQKLFSNQKTVLPVNPRVGDMEKFLVNEDFIQKDIPANLRELFANNGVIEDDFQQLFNLLDLRRLEGQNPVDPPPKGDVANKLPVGLVVWNATPGPRELMLRYKTDVAPTSIRLRMTQEDLWVFRSMFTVIKEINSKPIDVWLQILDGGQPSDAPVDQANVPIKQINYLDLAQYAMSAAEGIPGNVEITDPDTVAAPLAGNMNQRAAGPPRAQSTFSVGTTGRENEDPKILEGRYIDGRNQPVADPASPPFSEFKQMFVMMEFVMDQRLIPVLITQCANAPIIIETRQVLVDLTEVDNARAANAAEVARVVNRIEQSPHDARVTLRGVVYGYSPPKKERLGTGTDPEPSKRSYGVPFKEKKE